MPPVLVLFCKLAVCLDAKVSLLSTLLDLLEVIHLYFVNVSSSLGHRPRGPMRFVGFGDAQIESVGRPALVPGGFSILLLNFLLLGLSIRAVLALLSSRKLSSRR